MTTDYSKYIEFRRSLHEKINKYTQQFFEKNNIGSCWCDCHLSKIFKIGDYRGLGITNKEKTDFACLGCIYYSCPLYRSFTDSLFEEWKKELAELRELLEKEYTKEIFKYEN